MDKSTITHTNDMRDDLQIESSEGLFKSSLAGGGGLLWRSHYRPHILFFLFNRPIFPEITPD